VLLAAGPAALLLQIAHPLVAEAVARHSDFGRDPMQRLRATLDATLSISFGDIDQARTAASRVAATHRTVRGRLEKRVGQFESGSSYDARDPELGLWVHTTLVWMALDAFHLLVGPLAQSERDAYYQESKRFAQQFGVTDEVLPATYEDFLDYRASMLEGSAIVVGNVARALAENVLRPPVPAPVALGLIPLNLITAGLLPEKLRQGFGLAWGRPERLAFRAAALSAWASVKLLPASMRYWPHYRVAARRLGEGRGS
jgi:uncharacterized protein (DUF2236 family)